MKDLFLIELENTWDPVAQSNGAQKFLIGVKRRGKIIEAIVSIIYGEDNVTVSAHLSTVNSARYFARGIMTSILKDLRAIVRHYGPWFDRLECEVFVGGIMSDHDFILSKSKHRIQEV